MMGRLLRRCVAPAVRLLAACLVPAAAAAASPLTLGIVDVPNDAPLLVAELEGYFAAEGLDLKIIHCSTGRQCMQRLQEGAAQIVTSAEPPIALAVHGGVRFEIVATLARSSPDSRMIARADRGIRSAADLVGRRLGYLPGTAAHYYADTFLLLNGVDLASVQRVALVPADAAGPLVRGEVDAASLFQPHASVALAALGSQAVVLPLPNSFRTSSNLVSRPADHGVSDEDLRRVLRAAQRGIHRLVTEPVRTRAALARHLRVDPAILNETLDELKFGLGLEQSLVTRLEAQSRWAQRAGLVAPGPMPDYLARLRPAPLSSLDPRAVSIAR